MNDLKMLIWLTQLGLSVAVPLGGFIMLGLWLHSSLGWGSWTVWSSIVLGIGNAVSGFRNSLKMMQQLSDSPPIASHDQA